MLVLCCLKLGGARGQAERGELVFLQVPGFKKLQAFLHSQAFLQTLGETKDKTASDAGGREVAGIWHTERVRCSGKGDVGSGRMASVAQRLVGHAKRKHTVMKGGYW